MQKNRFKAINTLAVPLVTYSYNILDGNISEIRKIDVKTKKLFILHRMHHPRADVERLYVPHAQGGKGLLHM